MSTRKIASSREAGRFSVQKTGLSPVRSPCDSAPCGCFGRGDGPSRFVCCARWRSLHFRCLARYARFGVHASSSSASRRRRSRPLGRFGAGSRAGEEPAQTGLRSWRQRSMSSEKFRFIREVAIRYVGAAPAPAAQHDLPRAGRRVSPSPRPGRRARASGRDLPRRAASADRGRDRLDRDCELHLGASARGLPDGGGSRRVCGRNRALPPERGRQTQRADLEVTRRLAAAGRLLGIELLDHIVWARGGAFRSIAQMCPEPFSRDM